MFSLQFQHLEYFLSLSFKSKLVVRNFPRYNSNCRNFLRVAGSSGKSVVATLTEQILPSLESEIKETHLFIMTQHDLRRCSPSQRFNHLMAPHPLIMISRQPSLRLIILIIFPNMIHIRSENPRATLKLINLHDTQSRRMSRGMSQRNPLGDFKNWSRPGLPVDVELEIMAEVDAQVGFGGYGVEGVF